MASFAPTISPSPSGDPWAEAVSTFVGAPKPMWVLQAMSDGLSVCDRAAAIASSIASLSCPSIVVVSHPYERTQAGPSSETARSVDPSMVIELSS